jgi:hypothetical protein
VADESSAVDREKETGAPRARARGHERLCDLWNRILRDRKSGEHEKGEQGKNAGTSLWLSSPQ